MEMALTQMKIADPEIHDATTVGLIGRLGYPDSLCSTHPPLGEGSHFGKAHDQVGIGARGGKNTPAEMLME
jgi:hypothetical protein